MADHLLYYASSASLTIDIDSLASDDSLLAGRQSTVVDNSTDRYLDYLVTGVITTASSGLSDNKHVLVYLFAQTTDAPTYPAGLGATDADITLGSTELRDAGLVLAAAIPTNDSASVSYGMSAISVASCFGGICPQRWGVFLVHDSGAALASSGNAITYQGIYSTVT